MAMPTVHYLNHTIPLVRTRCATSLVNSPHFSRLPAYCLLALAFSFVTITTTTATMTRKKINEDELLARAEANSYRRGTHQKEDDFRDRNKHMDKTHKD
jgi:hypothetical protein